MVFELIVWATVVGTPVPLATGRCTFKELLVVWKTMPSSLLIGSWSSLSAHCPSTNGIDYRRS